MVRVSARVRMAHELNLRRMSEVPDLREPGQTPPPIPMAQDGNLAVRMRWPLTIMVVSVCGLMAFALHQCSPATQAERIAAAGSGVVKGMESLAAAISEHKVTESFVQHVDSLKPDLKNRMLVAERSTTEVFDSQDASWHGTATAELRVPVTYRYYVALTGAWDLQVHVTSAGVVGDVIAPDLRPLEPSFDTTRLEMKSANGWANWSGSQLQDDLLKNLTLKINTRAVTQLSQSFPAAHESVEKFVRQWMLSEYKLAPDTPIYLRIRFHNEPAPALETAPPKPGN